MILRAQRSEPIADPRPSALVVGGGVAGLVAARELALTGHRVVVLEAGEHPGGRVGAHTVDQLVLDAGAESFATRNDAVATLATELSLSSVAPATFPAWLHAGEGRDLPLPRSGMVGIPGDLDAPDVLAALGAEGVERAKTDLTSPVDAALLAPGVSLGTLVRARLGEDVLQSLVSPVVSGVHSANPDNMEADSIAPGLRRALESTGSLTLAAASLRAQAPAGSAVAGLVGGMNTLTAALLDDLDARGAGVVTAAAVDAVQRAEGQWLVNVGTDVLEADRLVDATHGPTAVDLLAEAVPGLAALRPQAGAGVSLVTLVVDQPELDAAPRGTGVLVAPTATDVLAKALTHSTAKWTWLAEQAGPGRHVLRLSYGRMTDRAARMADADDTTLIAQAIQDAAVLTGVSLTPADVLGADVVRQPGGLPSVAPGHRERQQAVTALLATAEGLDVVGAWRSGTGLASVVSDTRAKLGISAR